MASLVVAVVAREARALSPAASPHPTSALRRRRGAALQLVVAVVALAALTTCQRPAGEQEAPSAARGASAKAPLARSRIREGRNSDGTRKTFRAAPADVTGKMHVFAYDDFGPQAMAWSLIGMDCYGECCCVDPEDSFDVRVVVYRSVSEQEVRARFPTGPDTGEYRLVGAREAQQFVAEQLADLESWPEEERLRPLEAALRDTRDRLTAAFP